MRLGLSLVAVQRCNGHYFRFRSSRCRCCDDDVPSLPRQTEKEEEVLLFLMIMTTMSKKCFITSSAVFR